jgi:hypothetical protein
MVTTPSTPPDPTRDEVYTPPALFEKLGITFDLDVCAPEGGVPWIPARNHYSLKDDGLTQPWHGNVWMNPPYSNTGVWLRKWMQHRNGIALIPFARSRPLIELWDSDAHLAYPLDPTKETRMMTFVKNGKPHSIYMPVILAAYGDANVEALARLGRLR